MSSREGTQKNPSFTTRRKTRPTFHRHISCLDGAALKDTKALLQIAIAMRLGLDSKTYDRKWRKIKVYRDCFLHADAVEWMVQYLHKKDKAATEAVAVFKLNELVDAGYVSHVCNEHRFHANEERTLFFKFCNDAIDMDAESIGGRMHKKGNMFRRNKSRELLVSADDDCTAKTESDKENDEDFVLHHDQALQLSVKRLAASLEKYSKQMDEANGTIAVLEEAVVALGFACALALFVSSVLATYCIMEQSSMLLDTQGRRIWILGIALVFVSLVYGVKTHLGPVKLYGIAAQNFAVLFKLMSPTASMDESFMEDVEKENADTLSRLAEFQAAQGATVLEPESLIQKMKSVMSMRTLEPAKSLPRGASIRTKDRPGAIKMREAWDLPDVEKWPNRPVLLCLNTPASPNFEVPKYGTGPCPIGVSFSFSSDLFEGHCLVRLRDVPSDDPESDSKYFLGRRRKFQSVIQGRFKKPLKVSDVLTGHEFERPLRHLPPSWMVRTGTNLIRRLAPGAQIVLDDKPQYALAILAATSQSVSADMPGNEPCIATQNDIPEDLSVLGGIFSSKDPISQSARKRHLANPERASQYVYDTESVYTFDFYQQLLDVGSYSLDLGFAKLSLCKNLDGQPIQVMAKTVQGEYLWNFQLWHEELLD